MSAEAPEAVDRLLERMDDRLGALERSGDRRAIFLTVYRTMTATMRDALAGDRFLDREWSAALTANFGAMYFAADDAYRGGTDDCPRVWDRAFGVAGRDGVTVLEHALLGVNAHITYDLPQAVAETMRAFGDHRPPGADDGPARGVMARRRYDYEVVNFLLAETIDTVQDLLGSRFRPLLRVVDTVAGRLDEYFAESLLRLSRTHGWHVATALAHAETAEEQRRICTHLEAVALEFARRVDLVEMLPTRTARRLAHRVRAPFVEPDPSRGRAQRLRGALAPGGLPRRR